MAIKAKYIWVDGTAPTAKLRSKTKILADGTTELPIWGFDGSSTNQAPGDKSDCVLNPVFSCPDPIRGGDNILVMAEVLYISMEPHETNTRRKCAEVAAKYALLSFDATIRSNVTVGPPIDLLIYKKNTFEITRHRRLSAFDQDLNVIHASWEQSLRRAVEQLPEIHFDEPDRVQPAAGEWRPRPVVKDQT